MAGVDAQLAEACPEGGSASRDDRNCHQGFEEQVPEHQLDRRTRNQQQRRARVYAAATELIVEQGFENCTMDDIAERAGVARATVFNLFQRKTAFLDEWGRLRRQSAFDAVRDYEEDVYSLHDGLGRYFIELARLSTNSRSETTAFMRATVDNSSLLRRPALAAQLETLLAEAQHKGVLRAGVDIELAALTLAAGYFAVLTAWIDELESFDLRERLITLQNMVLDGVLERR